MVEGCRDRPKIRTALPGVHPESFGGYVLLPPSSVGGKAWLVLVVRPDGYVVVSVIQKGLSQTSK